jgi:hypothetical protein
MSLQEAASSPPIFLTLPNELHTAISTHLDFLDLHALRLTCHYFHARRPPPTHADYLKAERELVDLLACVGCKRLRHVSKFSANMKMKKKGKASGGKSAATRFCVECGCRPLPGRYRYMLGSRWEQGGVSFVRCSRCRICAEGPTQNVRLCVSCYGQDLQKSRGPQYTLWSEENQLTEGRLQCLERQHWIDSGRAESEYFENRSKDISDRSN